MTEDEESLLGIYLFVNILRFHCCCFVFFALPFGTVVGQGSLVVAFP